MKKISFLLLLMVFSLSYSFGQNDISGPIVQMPVYFDVSPPLRDMVKHPPPKAETSWKDGIVKNRFNIFPQPKELTPGGGERSIASNQDGYDRKRYHHHEL